MLIQRMRDWLSRRVRDERGFTLVELLMVMVIIGVLAGLGFTGYNALQTRAAVTQADVYWRDLNTAVGMNRVMGNAFPADIDDLSSYLDTDVDPWKGATQVGTASVTKVPADGLSYALLALDTSETPALPEAVCVWVNGNGSTQNAERCESLEL